MTTIKQTSSPVKSEPVHSKEKAPPPDSKNLHEEKPGDPHVVPVTNTRFNETEGYITQSDFFSEKNTGKASPGTESIEYVLVNDADGSLIFPSTKTRPDYGTHFILVQEHCETLGAARSPTGSRIGIIYNPSPSPRDIFLGHVIEEPPPLLAKHSEARAHK